MNILSLFDGISCARVALDVAGIPVNNYYSCEIEKNAMKVSKKNYPDIISLGNVLDLKKDMIKEPIDLLIGGSPCQDLSIAKKDRKGLEGDRSSLFFEYVRIKNEIKPKYFILENVSSMKKEDKDIITSKMGVEPIMFNASLVSAQTRKRYFWTNIQFDLPADRGILLKDILQPDAEVDERMVNKDGKSYAITSTYSKISNSEAQIKNSVEKKQRTMVKMGRIVGRRINDKGHRDDNNKSIPYKQQLAVRDDDKSNNLSTIGKDNVVVNLSSQKETIIRKLTPIECERLQSLPDNYTEGIAMTNRYKCLGNAFNVEVISHILKNI
jgi:DNA (cytosine-5)-methyltransferase 3A